MSVFVKKKKVKELAWRLELKLSAYKEWENEEERKEIIQFFFWALYTEYLLIEGNLKKSSVLR